MGSIEVNYVGAGSLRVPVYTIFHDETPQWIRLARSYFDDWNHHVNSQAVD